MPAEEKKNEQVKNPSKKNEFESMSVITLLMARFQLAGSQLLRIPEKLTS